MDFIFEGKCKHIYIDYNNHKKFRVIYITDYNII